MRQERRDSEIEWIDTQAPAAEPRERARVVRHQRMLFVVLPLLVTVVAVVVWRQTASGPSSTTGSRVVVDTGVAMLPAPSGIELIVHTAGSLVRIDLDHGRTIRTSIPRIASTGPTYVVPGSRSVLLRPVDPVAGYAVPDDGMPRALTGVLARGAPVYPGPSPDQLWMLDTSNNEHFARLATFEGAFTEIAIRIGDFFAWGPDGTGRVILRSDLGAFVAGPEGLTRITSGELLASGAAAWLTTECTDDNRCGSTVIDRVDGSLRNLRFPVTDRYGDGGVVSPDGKVAALVSEEQRQLTLVDLTTGAAQRLPDRVSTQLVWSTDSRFVLFVDSGSTLRYYDRTTETTTALAAKVDDVLSLSSRRLP